MLQPPRIPRATYRLQFNANFTFDDALNLLDYLHDLGVSDVYASPLFKPRTGSTHGYDIVDYAQFNPALGGEEGFNRFSDGLKARNMGLLLDIVPNHMGVNTENIWWMDVLKHGPASVYAGYFDIDWQPKNRAMDNKVLLPVLGDHYGRVLEAGEFKLVYWHGDFYLHYYEHQFPLTPETYRDILQLAHEQMTNADQWVAEELLSIITALGYFPHYTTKDPEQLIIRRREQVIIRRRVLALFDGSEAFRTALHHALELINGTPGKPHTFDKLDSILSRQPYRLSYWRVAADEINYRRFFDINDMAAIRIENPQVFEDTHRLVFRLLAEGKANGLRVDHPDGLLNPPAYFMQLQESYLMARLAHITGKPVENPVRVRERLALLQNDDEPTMQPLYVLVEKILSETEPLPYSWAVYGTTGYDFMNAVNSLFVDAANEARFDTLYEAFTGQDIPFHELTDQTKKLVMSEALTSELDARSSELARIVEKNRRYRGFTRNSIAVAMSEFIAALSIYRTYITGPGDITERDRHYIEEAIAIAKKRNVMRPTSLFDFLRDTLLLDNLHEFDESLRPQLREFVMKFQQITGPVMAKSVEDTAFYIYNRLISLNEVGGHPDQFGIQVADFHQHNKHKAFWYTMLSTSTHDTKRSEDVRARINVLSEMPDEWEAALTQWHNHNKVAKTIVDDEAAPAPNDEYLLYQTLVGAYEADDPQFLERVIRYMHKAINEAKVYSNWINPNDDYARAITDFVTHIMTDDVFLTMFKPFATRIAYYGRLNSLSQVVLKLTSPGVPDIYQGTELWDFSLVDPDNRRPVDFAKRRAILASIKQRFDSEAPALVADLLDDMEDGAIKLFVIHRILAFRREAEALFREGDYEAIAVSGGKAAHVCAFMRQHEKARMVVVVPRLILGLTNGQEVPPIGMDIWDDTTATLPEGRYQNIFTAETIIGSQIPVRDLLATFPVGVWRQITD
ncbi:MAG: malto-oligosyltrehalose synthase [Phototrophicales bacterium]|nr:MAG: malto-oligosyltrehalose synthase [Phototrophicales bacterium]